MASAWFTYAWEDNKNNDVDFVVQELIRTGLQIKLDRWNLVSGRRLWEQIEHFIQDPSESDAWIFFATQRSLGSQPCREEFAYALDRALHTRGGDFPIIALFPESEDPSLIPAAIRTKLYVRLSDPEWKEQIRAGVEGRPLQALRQEITPYHINTSTPNPNQVLIEFRPRAGVWPHVFAGVPIAEKDKIAVPEVFVGPAGVGVPPMSMVVSFPPAASKDGQWWLVANATQATPAQSCYLWCNSLPSRLTFGALNSPEQFVVTFPD